jgi:hypothetical protein
MQFESTRQLGAAGAAPRPAHDRQIALDALDSLAAFDRLALQLGELIGRHAWGRRNAARASAACASCCRCAASARSAAGVRPSKFINAPARPVNPALRNCCRVLSIYNALF